MSDLIALQTEYEELYAKPAADAYKNNEEWLRSKIDLALEKGPDADNESAPPAEEPAAPEKEPAPEAATAPAVEDTPKADEETEPVVDDEKGSEPAKEGETPQVVLDTMASLEAQKLIGTFYTGDGEGGNWEIVIDKSGASLKNLS